MLAFRLKMYFGAVGSKCPMVIAGFSLSLELCKLVNMIDYFEDFYDFWKSAAICTFSSTFLLLTIFVTFCICYFCFVYKISKIVLALQSIFRFDLETSKYALNFQSFQRKPEIAQNKSSC